MYLALGMGLHFHPEKVKSSVIGQFFKFQENCFLVDNIFRTKIVVAHHWWDRG